MAGKGDSPRPVNQEKYSKNYESIFGSDDEVRNRRQSFCAQKQENKSEESSLASLKEKIL